MKLTRLLTALFVSYFVVIVYIVDPFISLCLCIFLLFPMFYLARHSLPLLVLQFISLNTLIYTVSVSSLPPYKLFLANDLFRVCLYFAIFTITLLCCLLGILLLQLNYCSLSMLENPYKLLPLVLYLVAFAFLLSQGRTIIFRP